MPIAHLPTSMAQAPAAKLPASPASPKPPLKSASPASPTHGVMDEPTRLKIRRVADVLASILAEGVPHGTNGAPPERTIHIGKTEVMVMFKLKTAELDKTICALAADVAASTLDAATEAITNKELTIFKVITTIKRIQNARVTAEARANFLFSLQKILFGSAVLSVVWGAWKMLEFVWSAASGEL